MPEPSARPPRRSRNGTTVVLLVSVVAAMVGMSFASVPLYRVFCAATGFGGTTQRASVAPGAESNALITVRFNTDVAPDLAWEFRPLVPEVQVHPGEQKQVFFRAVNHSAESVTGKAIFNVTPTKSGIYFDKMQCFCFTEQELKAGESRDMGVVFFVDPDILHDPGTRDVRTITLSYSMFRAHDANPPRAQATPPQAARSVN
ncbi:MAG TPA: cytochrome c oxidase assembly protein [Stellaceae bacterium]|jgi:cytochrome c oxidase assembly protein subunit 11|nr:cytochrome c oxidase assembly protein [Stellaceae bacterium]